MFWPVLQGIESNSVLISNITILEEVFDFYGRCVASAGPLVKSEIPRLADQILVVFDVTNHDASLKCASSIVEHLDYENGGNEDGFNGILIDLLGCLRVFCWCIICRNMLGNTAFVFIRVRQYNVYIYLSRLSTIF